MFLIMGLVLAIGSTYSEIKLVHGSKFIRRLYTQGLNTPWGKIEGVYFNTFGSFFLSYIIGVMFSAEGLTVLFGGMLSTAFSQMYFSAEGFAHSRGWNLTKFKAGLKTGSNNVVNAKNSVVKTYRDFEQPLKDMRRGALITARVITMPFVFLRKASALYSQKRAA